MDSRLRRRVAVVLVTALVGGFGLQVGTAPAGAVACADVIVVRTMMVSVKPMAKSYPIGATAKVAVKVSRPASEDPLQQGVPMPNQVSQPADGATVGVGLHIGPVFAPGYAITDSNGTATVSIRIPAYAHPAVVGIDAYAYNILAQSPCYTIQEDGYTHKKAVFTVTK